MTTMTAQPMTATLAKYTLKSAIKRLSTNTAIVSISEEDTSVYNKLGGSNTTTKKTGYRIGDVIGAAIVTGVLVLVICAVMAYILVRRRQNFEVSKVYEKSMREDPDDSKYERTNGTDYPSETSKDRNSSAKLQPVVHGQKSKKKFTNLFNKKQQPEEV